MESKVNSYIEYRERINNLLASVAEQELASSNFDARQLIINLKSAWRAYSSAAVALREVRKLRRDHDDAGYISAERKIIAGRVQAAVIALNRALKEAELGVESEFADFLSSSSELTSGMSTPLHLTHDTVFRPELLSHMNISAEPLADPEHAVTRSRRLPKPSERLLLERESSTLQTFQKWLSLSDQMGPASSSGARSCLSGLLSSFSFREGLLSEIIKFYTSIGEITTAGEWSRKLESETESFRTAQRNLNRFNDSSRSNPFLSDANGPACSIIVGSPELAGSFSGFSDALQDAVDVVSVPGLGEAVTSAAVTKYLSLDTQNFTHQERHSLAELVANNTQSSGGVTEFFEEFVNNCKGERYPFFFPTTLTQEVNSYSNMQSSVVVSQASTEEQRLSTVGRLSLPASIESCNPSASNYSILASRAIACGTAPRAEEVTTVAGLGARPKVSYSGLSPRVSNTLPILDWSGKNKSLGPNAPNLVGEESKLMIKGNSFNTSQHKLSYQKKVIGGDPGENTGLNFRGACKSSRNQQVQFLESSFGPIRKMGCPFASEHRGLVSRDNQIPPGGETGWVQRPSSVQLSAANALSPTASRLTMCGPVSSSTHRRVQDWTFSLGPDPESELSDGPVSRLACPSSSGALPYSDPEDHITTTKSKLNSSSPKNRPSLVNYQSQDEYQDSEKSCQPSENDLMPYNKRSGNRVNQSCQVDVGGSCGFTDHSLGRNSYQLKLESDLLGGRGEKFDGNYQIYVPWRDRMKNYLRRAGSSAWVAMEILMANTTRGAHKVVRQLFHSQLLPELQLQRVWDHFDSRYGSGFCLSKSLLDQLRKLPRITSPSDIERMDELLTFCYCVAGSPLQSTSTNYLLSPEGLREMWEKMPFDFIEDWRKTCGSLRRAGNEPTLDRLITEMSNYIGDRADIYFYNASNSRIAPSTTRTLSTVMESPGHSLGRCILHEASNHETVACRQFLKLSVQRRRELVRKKMLCYVCFGPHWAKDCLSSERCNECDSPHNSLLHPSFSSGSNEEPIGRSTNISNCARLCGDAEVQRCCSKTLSVEVKIEGKSEIVRCLCIIDEQSNSSFCDIKLAESLGARGVEDKYAIKTMAGLKTEILGHLISGIQVRGIGNSNWIKLPAVWTHPSIPDTKSEVATRSIVQAHKHLIRFAKHFPVNVPALEVLLLVGTNCGPAMKTKIYGSTFPYAHRTALGWALVGPTCLKAEAEQDPKCLRTSCSKEHYILEPIPISSSFPQQCKEVIRDVFWEGHDDEAIALSQEDRLFLSIIKKSTKIDECGNLEFPLPLRASATFASNKRAVFLRSKNSLARVATKPELAARCAEVMHKYLCADHVEELAEEISDSNHLMNYVPVFPVTHPKKPKVRLVFDSSAQYNGSSLNDHLLQGPDSNNLLLGVLLRFRLFHIGFAADVESMFHCFRVSPEHRDLLRFFWWSGNNPGSKLASYRAKVHVFGNKSSPAIATYGLRYVTTLPDVDPWSVGSSYICNNFYVDDGIASARSVEEVVRILVEARKLLSRFNIRLHKIVSSSSSVLRAFPTTEIANLSDARDICCSPDQAALGLQWQVLTDRISVRVSTSPRPFTKRGVLGRVNSIFDPLGIVSPVVLGGKLLQRSIITSKKLPSKFKTYGWDDPLPSSALPGWEIWVSQLPELSEISIPRCFTPDLQDFSNGEIHMFADASEAAIGYVSYLRRVNRLGTVGLGFLMANSKVSPHSATSTPRMELCAAVHAALAARKIMTELNQEKLDLFLYTDSAVVLGYLRNTSKTFTRYVSSRVQIILACTRINQWNYICSEDNPADIASRFHTPKDLISSQWFLGPRFLMDRDLSKIEEQIPCASLPETLQVLPCLYTSEQSACPVLAALCSRSLSWMSIIKIVSKVYIFIHRCRRRAINFEKARDLALIAIIRSVQRCQFSEEIRALSGKRPIIETSQIVSHSPFLDSAGILRIGGRLANSPLPFEEKHPIILPPHHFITSAILLHYHEKSIHQGRSITTALIRQAGFHIHRQKSIVGKFLRNCVLCRRLRGGPQGQIMADLPNDRLEKVPPFWHCGVDIFGPYLVYDGRCTRRTKASKKTWVVLFTCLYSRAIHVDLIPSLESSAFHLALRRFVALRGECRLFRSDCGSNFVGLENQKLSVEEISRLVISSPDEEIKWKFTPPRASHFAGVWERKVGSVKRILDASLHLYPSCHLSRDEFATLLQEAANIVNQTPLGEISSDSNDPFPVAPAALLTLREATTLKFTPHCASKDDLQQYGLKRWRRVQFLAEEFWQRWRRDYLTSAYRRRKWRRPHENLQEGDIVLLRDDAPRNEWPMGLVIKTYPDRNGFVRRVDVRQRSLRGAPNKIMHRAVSDLILISPVHPR